jgi:eukaryotic-like serine/threonine-protein kinase
VIGQNVAHYHVMEKLGAGGMGVVYRARDQHLRRFVALKILPERFAADPDRLRRFEREAISASALNHPNIVTIYEIGRVNSTVYIAMELVDGKTLREMLISGPPPLASALELATQLADGLSKVHEAGLVHRDLKPENVMVTSGAHAKILDFGLAKLAPGPIDFDEAPTMSAETTMGALVGTLNYMSPEQVLSKPTDFRSDQFSFGVMLCGNADGEMCFPT